MQIRHFQASDFPAYESWFADPVLNAQLGPMDQDWLNHVLNDTTTAQYSVVRGDGLVAVVGVCLPNEAHPYYFITDFAVRPDLRGRGVGRSTQALLMAQPDLQLSTLWRAGVVPDNSGALTFLARLGWTRREPESPFDELVEFEFQRQPAVPGFR